MVSDRMIYATGFPVWEPHPTAVLTRLALFACAFACLVPRTSLDSTRESWTRKVPTLLLASAIVLFATFIAW